MKRMLIRGVAFFVVSLVTAFILGEVTPARSCSCNTPNLCTAIFYSTQIFAGHCISVVPGPRSDAQITARLTVFDRFKGIVADTVDVITNSSPAACGFPFATNTDYLVFSVSDGAENLYAGLCSYTSGYDPDSPILPLLRLPCTTAIEPGSWSRIKALYARY